MKKARVWIAGLVVGALLLGLGALVARRLLETEQTVDRAGGPQAFPVEVAPVTTGPIEDRRRFSGALEATARVTIAPKVAGRIVSLPFDLADTVHRGDVVARLDSAEFEQNVAQARAERAVAEAGLVQARQALDIAQRELEREQSLFERGIASESSLDAVRADHSAATAQVEVAKAQVTRAEAALESARIRLGYTTIRAEWEEGDDTRVVAERFVEQGDTVSANTPLLSTIELDPIEAVIFATERDYALLSPGQPVSLATDAFPDRHWEGRVARIAPVFREGSRQARVEIAVDNEGGSLKPGMFVRVEAVLGREQKATIVPAQAITTRAGSDVVFLIDRNSMTARMAPVRVGIREGERVQVTGEDIRGDVVTLGQQLLSDGASVVIPGAGEEQQAQGPAPEISGG
jgi:RND family efflux transporter MFP subunit